ncbi:MAG: acyl-CoA dehydrogenase [Acidimicrobiales bacterium]
MDVRFSAEQQALRDAARRLAEDLAPQTVRDLDDTERTAKLDAAVTAAGWRELRAATEVGDPWASGVEVAVIAEQLGRRLADTAFVGPTLAAELRRAAGAPATMTAETVVLTPDLGTFATTVAGQVPAGAVAIDVAGASSALVLMEANGGWSLASVAMGEPARHVDLTRPVAAPSSPATLVDGQTTGIDAAALDRATALGLAVCCADLVGSMQGAVELSTEYAAERKQYGRPVGTFQSVQHLLADALVATEGSRSLALHAAWVVDALAPADALTAAATAKSYAARAAREVCETAIQVHGGIGNTWECLAHVYLRRALLSTDVLGGVDASLARVLDAHLGGPDGLR